MAEAARKAPESPGIRSWGEGGVERGPEPESSRGQHRASQPIGVPAEMPTGNRSQAWWDGQRATIEALYLGSRWPSNEIGGLYGISRCRMDQIMRRWGVPKRQGGFTGAHSLEKFLKMGGDKPLHKNNTRVSIRAHMLWQGRAAEIAERLNGGESCTNIARHFGCSKTSLCRWLSRLGIRRRWVVDRGSEVG